MYEALDKVVQTYLDNKKLRPTALHWKTQTEFSDLVKECCEPAFDLELGKYIFQAMCLGHSGHELHANDN
eukprot:snap_masked-scaffold_6-processed-gene-19.2-mRNA-1 protein AED:1.00 eAED:1.00 QI:0/0/0/0/1/1/2/0/69